MENNKKAVKEFGKYLKHLRTVRGFKGATVARAAGLTRAQLCSYESGTICMGMSKFDKIADALMLNVDERRELFNLLNDARLETYSKYSSIAKDREERKRIANKIIDINNDVCYNNK